MYMWRGMYLGRLEETTRSPRTGVTDSCGYVLGTKLKVLLWKNNCSQGLSCLFSPHPVLLRIEPRTSQIQIHPRQTVYHCLTFQTLNYSLFTYFNHHDYYYISVSILATYMSVQHINMVPMKARRGHWIPQNLEVR